MPHAHDDDARRTFGDKLDKMVPGHSGEHPIDRAARIAGVKVSASAQGDGAQAPEEVFVGVVRSKHDDRGRFDHDHRWDRDRDRDFRNRDRDHRPP